MENNTEAPALSMRSTLNQQPSAMHAQTPGLLHVIRRNGQEIAVYNDEKIKIAMTKAFLAVEGDTGNVSDRIHDIVERLTSDISNTFIRRLPTGGTIHIEDIQDQVELALMRAGEHKVARAYVLYREERRKAREQAKQINVDLGEAHKTFHVVLPSGEKVPLNKAHLQTIITEACAKLTDVHPEKIIEGTYQNLFDGAPIADVSKAMIMTARTFIEMEPNYSFVTARLLLDTLQQEALEFLGMEKNVTFAQMQQLYLTYFKRYIERAIELELLDPRLKQFDLEKLSQALLPERDFQFNYLGLQTLYDRYFIHSEGIRFELPQAFFMRVAMGLALLEPENKEQWAIEFYQTLSSFDYMSSTPTLFNSGTLHPQLSSCYLTTVPDDLSGIYSAIRDNALLSKFAGGLGNDWSNLRGMGAHIKGTNGKSLGVIPFLNVANATAIAVNQGGKRKGAVCAYLEFWHADILDFLELRKNTGDDRRRTHDMNTAVWVPDLFMKRLYENGEWTLFSPDEVPHLHDSYGSEFEKLYLEYEEKARTGKIKNVKKIPAQTLWRKTLGMLFETGHPWITFKDPCNLRSPQQHAGVVHSSNLCTEITLNTSLDEIAVCNLGSINLVQHIKNGQLDMQKLQRSVRTAIRMLDNVIDYNFYPVPQAQNSNLRHRPIGLGLMGFQDALYALNIDYASDAAVEFADRSMEAISYFAIEASCELAKERGTYPSFEGSLWSQGILPIDSIQLLENARGKNYLKQNRDYLLDWPRLRELVKTIGMRNSNVMAIAPTATISNICGVSASIEPTYQNLFVKSNLSGEFTVINPYLVNDLKRLNLWDKVMVNDLKYFDGSVQKIQRIPDEIKQRYATAFEMEPLWLVKAGARRQKWIDQAQSLNLYLAAPSGKKMDELYRQAWELGLKTTYYFRSLGATSTEKATIHDGTLNAVKIQSASNEPKACSIDNPDCESCQ